MSNDNFINNLSSQQYRSNGRTTSWLISFGDLLTLLVCFFLSVISFTNYKKQSNSAELPKILDSEAVLQDKNSLGQQTQSTGTLLADKYVRPATKESFESPITIEFVENEFEGSKRQLSMTARERLKLAISLASYRSGDLVISSCFKDTEASKPEKEWDRARLQAIELKRQLIDAGWKGAPQDIRMQILGQHCKDLDNGEFDQEEKIALIKIKREIVSNG